MLCTDLNCPYEHYSGFASRVIGSQREGGHCIFPKRITQKIYIANKHKNKETFSQCLVSNCLDILTFHVIFLSFHSAWPLSQAESWYWCVCFFVCVCACRSVCPPIRYSKLTHNSKVLDLNPSFPEERQIYSFSALTFFGETYLWRYLISPHPNLHTTTQIYNPQVYNYHIFTTSSLNRKCSILPFLG